MPGSVLVIDSDVRTYEALSFSFTREHLHIIPAVNGRAGIALASEQHPDAVLLEVSLPDIDGWSVLRRLRQSAHELPVIMLTVRRGLQDRIMGLEIGADDYIAKPFEPREVLARIRAVCRRVHRRQPDLLEFPDVSIDVADYTVICREVPVPLSPREFSLFLTLARQAPHVVSRRQLCEVGWEGDGLDNDHALDVAINRLRKKLFGPDAHLRICTVRGVGYRFLS